MKIVVKTKNTDFSMPVPLAMAELAINNMPESIFGKGREKMGPHQGIGGDDVQGMQGYIQTEQRA